MHQKANKTTHHSDMKNSPRHWVTPIKVDDESVTLRQRLLACTLSWLCEVILDLMGKEFRIC